MKDDSVVLTLKIDNSQPVKLAAFVHAFTSLANEYTHVVRGSDLFDLEDAEVYVKEVRSGSIVADLIPAALPLVPLVVSEVDRLVLAAEVVTSWKTRLTQLMSGVVPKNATKADLKHWAGAVEAIARDPNARSTLEAATYVDGERKVKATFTFNTPEAIAIENVINGEYQRLEEKKDADYHRVLMVFTRSDVGDAPVGKRSGERVVIEEISNKPLAITYGSQLAEERIKHEIREGDENIYKKGFNVDVKVQSVGTRTVAYSITNVHEVVDLPD